MVNSEVNFIGTPNNPLLKLPPDDEDDELYMSEVEPVDMYLITDEDELDEDEEDDDPVYVPELDNDDDDEDYFFSDDSASTYDVYEESGNTDDYISETDDSTDSNMSHTSTQTDTNVANGS